MHKPHFFGKMKAPQAIQPQNPEPEGPCDTAKSLDHEAYAKAFADAKVLFDASMKIDQKISDGISRVDKQIEKYTTIIIVILTIAGFVIALASFLGSCSQVNRYRADVEKTISERFVSEKITKQLKKYSDDNVAPLINESVKETEEGIKAELERIRGETAELQTAILSAREEMDELSSGLLESQNTLSVYEKIAEARAGNRMAYDSLLQIAKNSNYVAHIASLGVAGIVETYEEKRRTFGRAPMGLQNVLTGKISISIPAEEAMYYVYTDDPGTCEGALNNLADRNQLQYVATLVHAVRGAKKLECVYTAIRCLEKVLGKQFPTLGIDEVLSWWAEHNGDETYHNSFERVCEISQQQNESEEIFKWRNAMLWKQWIDEKPEQYWAAQQLVLFLLNIREDGTGKRKEMLEDVFDYWASEHPHEDMWYLEKTLYLYIYEPGQVVDFVNARLADYPFFEDELRRYESVMFPKQLFEIDQINWPSKSSKNPHDGGSSTEKAAE